MSQTPRSLNESTPSDNADSIVQSFASPDWYLKGFAANIRVRAETVSTLLGSQKFEQVLDIGCGDGSLSLPLLPNAKGITYLDQSAAMLERVASRIDPARKGDIAYINSGFMEATVPATTFDLVICVGVLAYVDDLGPFLKKVRNVMKPGGQLLLECTDAPHFLTRMTNAYRACTSILKPKRFGTYPHKATSVIAVAESFGLKLAADFRYAYSFPLVEKFVSDPTAYKLIRKVYGTIDNNRRAWMGNQRIFHFRSASGA